MNLQEKFYTKKYIRRFEGDTSFRSFHPRFIDFHKMDVSEDYTYPKHIHSHYELIWIEQGPYSCMLNEEEIILTNHQILLIKPGDEHEDHLKKGQTHFVLHFDLQQDLFNNNIDPKEQVCPSDIPEGLDFFHQMIQDSNNRMINKKFSSSLQDALLETFFWRVLGLYRDQTLSSDLINYSDKQDFVSKLYTIFSSQPYSMGVEEIAEKMAVSRRSLSLKSQKYLLDSPARLYLEFRIEESKALLQRPSVTIKEISQHLGFDTPFSFSRAFKRVTGSSPLEYRRKKNEA